MSTVSLASQGSGILFGDAYPSPTTWLDRNDRIRRRNNSEISERLSAMKIEGLLRILGDQIQVPDEGLAVIMRTSFRHTSPLTRGITQRHTISLRRISHLTAWDSSTQKPQLSSWPSRGET